MRRPHRGFTLIELVIVVIIIGILASVGIPRYRTTRDRAYRASMQSDLRNLAVAQDGYFFSQSMYSPDLPTLNIAASRGIVLTVVAATNTGWSATAGLDGGTGTSCAVFNGDAAPPSPATVEGLITCAY